VLLPGFVNAHAHVELSHLAGRVAGGDGLVPWVRRLLALRAETLAPAAALWIARAVAARGTVAIADVTNAGQVAGALREAGVEVLALDERIAPRGEPQPTRPGATAVPHATYTCGAGVIRALASRSNGCVRSIHVDEDPAEARWLVEGIGPLAELLAERDSRPEGTPCGLRPVPWLDTLGVIGPRTLLVHLACADDASIAIAVRRGAVAVLCPRSNLHIGNRLPPWDRIRAAGLRVALGTDSLASSPSLDVLGEVATLAQAGADPGWLLRAITLDGAYALELPHLGALARGLRPGLVELGDDARGLDHPIAWAAHEGAAAPARRLA
jgi:cytosine/adenosine deaminase-related metal-dependent hydrolase